MEVTQRIDRSFADEHVIGCDPPLRPDLPNVWRRRMHPFAGRAVSDKALTAEQEVRSGLQRLYGLSLAPGCVAGLEVSAEPGSIGAAPGVAQLLVSPGIALAVSGEDISIGAARRVSLAELPVIMRVDHADAIEEDTDPDVFTVGLPLGGDRLRPVLPRRIGPTFGGLTASSHSRLLPQVAVLVARPVTATILGRPMDACPPDARDDAYVDLQRIDGAQLALFLWPAEVTATDGSPDYALPSYDKAQRNRLAYAVFDNEKLFAPGDMHPWDSWGVPLATIGFNPDWSLAFVDRFSVVRTGGTPGNRTPLVPMTGDPRLWQARIDQFVGQLVEQPSFDEVLLRDTFVRLPPVGLIPRDLFDPVLRRQTFFPGSFALSALPVPQSNLDLAIRESASLASYNRSAPDRVELLVPVPDTVYEPHLLEIEVADPRFATTMAAFAADRARWLATREIGRRRLDRLNEAISGQPGRWPAADLPMSEDSPDPGDQPPVECTRTRRFDVTGTKVQLHTMAGAAASLPIAKTDTVWVWVRIQSVTDLTGISLRLGTATSPVFGANFTKGAFWGAPDGLPAAAGKAGALPRAGAWVRLDVPASIAWDANGGSLDGFAVNAVEFGQRGGQVEWGPFGTTDASGNVATFIADDAPAGSGLFSGTPGQTNPTAGWPWKAIPGREDIVVADFGTLESGGVREVAALDPFRDQWKQEFLKQDLKQLEELGLDAFLGQIKARLDATNDAIDLGFVRARSDIYRVRQYMLGADSASRLVTSPTLADLSARDESARTTSEGIASFLDRIKAFDTPTPTPSGGSSTSSSSSSSSSAGVAALNSQLLSMAFVPQIMTLNVAAPAPAPAPAPAASLALLSSTRFAATSFAAISAPVAAIAPAETRERLLVSSAASALAAPSAAAFSTPLTLLPTAVATTAFRQTAIVSPTSLGISKLGLTSNRYEPADIRASRPVAGLVERTLSVAERIKPPAAAMALDYAIASKAAVINTLAALTATANNSRPRGIALGDLPMPGFRLSNSTDDDPVFPTLDQVINPPVPGTPTVVDMDTLPADKHESTYFTAAVKAIDNSIAIMRLVEGRISLFEDLRDSIDALRGLVLNQANQVAAWLRSVDVEVEEARHDVAVAQQLYAEELARVDTVNARRSAVLETHVSVIAWRRVREADYRDDAPLLEMASGLAPDPVIACRQEHPDVPEELDDYVELLRDAPVKWFPTISAEVARIDRLEAARAAIEAMRYRAMLPIIARTFVPTTRIMFGVQQAFVAQQRVVQDRRALVTQIDYSRLAVLSLAQTHVQIQQTASLGDLIDGRHRQPTLTRMATSEMEAIGQVAACLHAAFAEVAPVVRLAWAEILSEFDRPAPLSSLAGLPGWPEVPIAERRTLQGFVDWLFGRIDRSQQDAVNAINELVRIALLMSAHAPVDAIIPARLVAPVPAVLGTRFQLALDISRVRKGMITVIRDRDDRIVSRAVVDDLVDGHAMVVMTQNLAGITILSNDLRFHLVTG